MAHIKKGEYLCSGDSQNKTKITQYIIIREDLPPGVQLAQTTHAARESSGNPIRIRGAPIYAVVLYAKNEKALMKLEERLLDEEIEHKAIREPDAPWRGALMAIGIAPTPRENVAHLTKKYKKAGWEKQQ